MKRTSLKANGRALRAMLACAALALSIFAPSSVRAEDAIGIVLSASPSGAETKAIAMRIPADATDGSIPIFARITGEDTLFGVEFSATPLVDEKGVASVTPAFDPPQRTIPSGGALRRLELKVSELQALGTFTSTLYATIGNRTQTLGTLTVAHTRRSGELFVSSIAPARSIRQIPGAGTRVTMLVTVRNNGDSEAALVRPVIAGLATGGDTKQQARLPAVVVSEQDGRPTDGPFILGPGQQSTLTVVLDDVKDTGAYTGTLRVSAAGHDPVEQSFAFQVKQGAALPVALIALGVAIAYAIRRRYSSGRISRAGQRRVVARLLSDLEPMRRGVRDLEPREAEILESLVRRLGDVSDELELAGVSRSAGVLTEIDHKIDLFMDFVTARRHVRAMTPKALQEPFESQLEDVAAFLTEATQPVELEARFGTFAARVGEMPQAVEASVRDRFQSDVDRFLAEMEAGSVAAEGLPLRVLKRVANARQLADAGRFTEARSDLGGAQLAFARFLAEDLAARMPDPSSGPPGFEIGWQRFRAATLEDLKGVRRERRAQHAAEAYRSVWQDYVVELATRLKAAASRERRKSSDARREQLVRVMTLCDETVAKALEFDPSTVDAYRRGVEGYLAPVGRRRSSAMLRSMIEEAQLPPPLTVVAAGLGDNGRRPRPTPRGAESAASLTEQIRKRHFGLALASAVVAIPAGLALLWAPNDTWGNLADGVTIFFFGLGLYAVAAAFDSLRLGSKLARSSAPARQSNERKTLAPASSST
jgi:hypothetical protein